mmetsp:Transcript_6721/g.14136  ORF Transcript_6721/g.14136 Transcript_6721/m.14136 type:complete len:315 (-) Transcript_6721:18-962(-)
MSLILVVSVFAMACPLLSAALALNFDKSTATCTRTSSENNRRSFVRDAASISFGAATTAVLPACAPSSLISPSFADAANAISANEASQSYDTYAATYDELDGGAAASALGIEAARSAILSRAKGRVLEIGVGTGLNVNKYKFSNKASATDSNDNEGVTSLTLVDISDGMLDEARAKISALNLPQHIQVEFLRADATSQLVQLFGKNSFDTVVDTFSLCVMGNEGAKNCLLQMRDVVKDQDGRILLIENTRSSNPLLGLYQDATADAASQVGGKGCIYNQNVTGMIQWTPGLAIEAEDAFAAGLFRSYVCRKNKS